MRILILACIFLLLIIFLLLFYILGSFSKNGSPEVNWGNIITMIVTIITAIATFLTAMATLNTVDEMKQAREQSRTEWLNDAFIKHEADVLLEFRIAYGDTQEAINFFLNNILNPVQKMDVSIKEAPMIKRERFIKYYNLVNHLGELYCKNQYIFRKHGLAKSISCLKYLLDAAAFLPETDLKFSLIDQDDKTKNYQLVEWNKIKQSFVLSAYSAFNPIKDGNDMMIQLQNINMDREFDRLKGFVSDELNSLAFKLDKLTLYNDSSDNADLNVRQSWFYPDLTK